MSTSKQRFDFLRGYEFGSTVSLERAKEAILKIKDEEVSENLYPKPQYAYDHACNRMLAKINRIMQIVKVEK